MILPTVRFTGAVILALIVFVACTRRTRPVAPGRVGSAEGPRLEMNRNVFAADGMCADKLTEHFKRQMYYMGPILDTLNDRLAAYKTARNRVSRSRYTPDPKSELRAAEALKETFAFWRDVYAPFNRRYGTFWCLRRADMTVLSSAELERGIDVIWATVKHLGPLSVEQNFELKE